MVKLVTAIKNIYEHIENVKAQYNTYLQGTFFKIKVSLTILLIFVSIEPGQ